MDAFTTLALGARFSVASLLLASAVIGAAGVKVPADRPGYIHEGTPLNPVPITYR